MIAPVIPGLNDHEIPALLRAAKDAGADWAGYQMLRLPHGVKDLFASWLRAHAPDRAEHVLSQIRETRRGALSDSRFGTRMRGEGPRAEQIAQLFELGARKMGLKRRAPTLDAGNFLRSGTLALFPPAQEPT